MQTGGLTGAIFLAYVLILLPWMAIKSARRLNAAASPAARPLPPRRMIYANTLVMLLVLFALSWFTARAIGFPVFAVPLIGAMQACLAGAGALIFQFAVMAISRQLRSVAERSAMPVNRFMPQTPLETALYSAMAIAAGVAEETAYRGVLVALLLHALGNPWLAVLISASAFTLGHSLQGRKSMAMIFIMACSMHALVWYSGTQAIAMAVHAIYDLLAPTLHRRTSPEPPINRERIAG